MKCFTCKKNVFTHLTQSITSRHLTKYMCHCDKTWLYINDGAKQLVESITGYNILGLLDSFSYHFIANVANNYTHYDKATSDYSSTIHSIRLNYIPIILNTDDVIDIPAMILRINKLAIFK